MKTETLYAGTYTALAGRLGEDRTNIARALAEPSAPQKTRRGWKLQSVRDWLLIRRLQKMSGADFDKLCTEAEAEPFDPETFFDPDNARRMLADIRQQGRQAYIQGLRN